MALIIAFANHKGGVAKTTSVGALGVIFAEEGYRVLMVDLDAQANLTYSFVDTAKKMPTRFVYDAIRERRDIPRFAVKDRLYIAPSGLEMTLVEGEMTNMRRREYILTDLLRPVEGNYDFILLDCPPSLQNATQNALAVADRLAVPVTADQFSYNGLKMMQAFVESMRDLNPRLRINDVFFTRYNPATNLARSSREAIEAEFPQETFRTVIRQTVKTQEASSMFMNVVDYSPKCSAALDYRDLAREYGERLNRELGSNNQ